MPVARGKRCTVPQTNPLTAQRTLRTIRRRRRHRPRCTERAGRSGSRKAPLGFHPERLGSSEGLRKGKKGRRAGGSAPSRPLGGGGVAGFSRATDQLHVLTPHHLERFAAVVRARPDLAPLLDLRQFEAGCESIEELSRRSHGHLVAHGLDPQLFSVFCELNAERLLATLQCHLDEEGLPLDEQAVLGELYARLHRWYFERGADSPSRPAALENALFQAMGRATSVIHGLAEVGRQIVTERVRMLRASAIPIASAPVAAVAVAETLIVDAARHLTERRLRLRATDLRRWITCALLGMPGVELRLIHLRCRRELTLQEIAERVGLAPFEAGVRLRNAVAALHDEVERLLRLHEGDGLSGDGRPELARPPGRLLELRPRPRESASSDGAKEPDPETASSDDEGAEDD